MAMPKQRSKYWNVCTSKVLQGLHSLSLKAGLSIIEAIKSTLPVSQMKSICNNMTQIEEWIVDKAKRWRTGDKGTEPFVFPYDLGRWRNFTEVCQSTMG